MHVANNINSVNVLFLQVLEPFDPRGIIFAVELIDDHGMNLSLYNNTKYEIISPKLRNHWSAIEFLHEHHIAPHQSRRRRVQKQNFQRHADLV
jgi:hypothetical protein